MTTQRMIEIAIALYVVAGIGLAIVGTFTWGAPGERGTYVDGLDQSPAARGVPFWQHVTKQLIGR